MIVINDKDNIEIKCIKNGYYKVFKLINTLSRQEAIKIQNAFFEMNNGQIIDEENYVYQISLVERYINSKGFQNIHINNLKQKFPSINIYNNIQYYYINNAKISFLRDSSYLLNYLNTNCQQLCFDYNIIVVDNVDKNDFNKVFSYTNNIFSYEGKVQLIDTNNNTIPLNNTNYFIATLFNNNLLIVNFKN